MTREEAAVKIAASLVANTTWETDREEYTHKIADFIADVSLRVADRIYKRDDWQT